MENGEALKRLRLKHGLSLRKMCIDLGVTEPAVRSYEKATKLSLQRLEQYCVILEEKEILDALNQLEELL